MLDALQEPGGEYFDWKARDGQFSVDGGLCTLTMFAVDPDSIRTGWGKLATGMAPDYRWSDVANTKVPKPGDDFKPAFALDVYVTEKGGAPSTGWKPWSTTGRASRDALTAIWGAVHDGAKANAGKIAILRVDEIISMQYGPAIVKAPKFSLVKWIAKPDRIHDTEPEPDRQPETAVVPDDDNLF
tara:strand:+ start:152 stop:706 length:555 start_codon:yes stop_codon:yes gene_type:complete